MRLALLGVDDQMMAVANAAVQGGRDQIVMIDALAPRASEAAAVAPQARMFTEWEGILHDPGIDAVALASDQPELRVEQLRRFLQIDRAIPLLISHPLCLSMLEYYELEMIRQEMGGMVVAYLPDRWHPAAVDLAEMVDGGAEASTGQVEQIVMERFLQNRQRDAVQRAFARDADLLQFIAGDATRLHALGSGGEVASANPYASLSVQMTCDNGLVCRWSVAPVENVAGGKLTLVGSRGRATLWIPERDEPWRRETRIASESQAEEYPEWSAPAEVLDMVAMACVEPDVESNLNAAARCVELAETIDRSLKRGRTIDLHSEEFTDIGTFKGTMASIGCGLLMVGLGLVVVVAMLDLVAQQAGWNQLAAVLHHWPYLLLAVCGLFLVLQFFVFVGKSPRSHKDAKQDESG